MVLIAGAVGSGLYFGYEIWANNSFPAEQQPFADYAKMDSAVFNGTVYYFRVNWTSGDATPMFAQLTSTGTDSVNSAVCDLRIAAPPKDTVVSMPFSITGGHESLSQVDLSIAVRSTSGSEFTIVYHVDSAQAQVGDLNVGYTCKGPNAVQ